MRTPGITWGFSLPHRNAAETSICRAGRAQKPPPLQGENRGPEGRLLKVTSQHHLRKAPQTGLQTNNVCYFQSQREQLFYVDLCPLFTCPFPQLHPPLPRLCLLPSGPLPKTPSPRTPEAKPSSRGVFTSHCTHSRSLSVCPPPPPQTLMSRVLGHVRVHLRPQNQAHKDCSMMEICIFFKIHPQPSPSRSQGKQHTQKKLLHNQPPRVRDISPS